MESHINISSKLSRLDAFGFVQMYITDTLDGFTQGINDAVIRCIVDSIPAATNLEPIDVITDKSVPDRVIKSAIARELIRFSALVDNHQKSIDEFPKIKYLPSSDFDESIKHEVHEIGGVDLSAREWLTASGMYDAALDFWRDSIELYEIDAYTEIQDQLSDALEMHGELLDIASRIMGEPVFGVTNKQALIWAYKVHSKEIIWGMK